MRPYSGTSWLGVALGLASGTLLVWGMLARPGVAQGPADATGGKPASAKPISGGSVAEVDDLASYYGFRPVEIHKLSNRSGNLVSGDVTGDGRLDLVLVDNSNSRIDILEQRKQPEKDPVSARANSIGNDGRFRHQKLGVDRPIGALTIGDFNSDKLSDLAYFGAPDQLLISLQRPGGEWETPRRIRIPEVTLSSWIIAAGDLNGDKRDDLVVLAKGETHLLYQTEKGELALPVSVMNTTENLGLVNIADLDGDGRNDLCYLSRDDQERPFCVRLQGGDGKLGPELRGEMPKPRGFVVADVDGKPGAEVCFIEGQTGRVKVMQWAKPQTQAGDLPSQLVQYGFGKAGSRGRDLAVGDLDGDGLADVVATDPDSAQMIVYRQQPGTGLDQGQTFPGLVGSERVRIGAFAGPKAEKAVVVLSPKEKAIGLSHLRNGRLTFPQAIPVNLDPVAMDVADLDADGKSEIVLVVRERTGSSSNYLLAALTPTSATEFRPFDLGMEHQVKLSLKSAPERIVVLDANHDGVSDFLLFVGSDRPPVFLLGKAGAAPSEMSVDAGIGLGSVGPGGLTLGKLERPAVLVAQSNFTRNIELAGNLRWRVVDQYNAPESAAKVSGVATLDLDGQPGNELAMIDLGVKRLRVLRREGTVYRPWREVEIGDFSYRANEVADLNGDGRPDLLLWGNAKFGVLYSGLRDAQLKPLASFETKLENARFNDLVVGDINNDGQTDVIAVDTQTQFIEVLRYTAKKGLEHAFQFKVFEAKSITGSERGGADPRESLLADVTGDGLPDLILLTQDRLLVYPQDAGDKPGPPAKNP